MSSVCSVVLGKKESARLKLTKQTIIRGKADRKGSRVSQWVKCSVKYPEAHWFGLFVGHQGLLT